MKLQSIITSVAGWLGAERKQTSHRNVRRPALKLEALEERDCPSTFGDAIQFQNDLNYLAANQWAPDTTTLQNDINQVQNAALFGGAGSAVQILQNDMNSQSNMWGSLALSSNYTLQYDLQKLIGDVNGGSGSGGNDIYSSNPYPVGSLSWNLQNEANQAFAANGGSATQSQLGTLLGYGNLGGSDGMSDPSFLQGANQTYANYMQGADSLLGISYQAPSFNYYSSSSPSTVGDSLDPYSLLSLGGYDIPPWQFAGNQGS